MALRNQSPRHRSRRRRGSVREREFLWGMTQEQKAWRTRQRQQLRSSRHELLEDRWVLTNYLLIDFTPDTITGEFSVAPFADIFDGSTVNSSNQYLNFDNSDNVLDADDAAKAAKKIVSHVRQIFAPIINDPALDLRVLHTPNVTNSSDPGAGERLLDKWDDSTSDNVYVVYVGAERPSPDVPRIGMAHQAPEGLNNEMYSYVFAEEIATFLTETHATGPKAGQPKYIWNGNQPLGTKDFTATTAMAIAHELGHLLSLGHVAKLKDPANPLAGFIAPQNYHHVMNGPEQANPKLAKFQQDNKYFMELLSTTGDWQMDAANSGFSELQASFATDGSGNLVQGTQHLADFPYTTYQSLPTGAYHGFGDEADFLPEEYAPPTDDLPPAASGNRRYHRCGRDLHVVGRRFQRVSGQLLG